ncbi:MAG: DUF192 domain-containing protein [Burkholderiaceae bacterium]|nr:DUF192 domain-containing protein [Burkholderiaceae bacterium]
MTALVLMPATSFWQRLAGLHAYSALSATSGLWISPCRAIHTLGLNYAIDVLYLDAQQNIIRRLDALAPNRLSLCWPARSVVELPAGFCARHPDYPDQVALALLAPKILI